MARLGIDIRPDLSPAVEELLEGFATTAPNRLAPRERRVETLVSLAFAGALAAMVLATATGRSSGPDPWLAAMLVAVYAVARRVRFPNGADYTVPTQLVFVPMLLLLEAVWLAPLVALGIALGNLPDYLARRTHPERLLLVPGDAAHALGPALVLLLAGTDVGDPTLADWPVYLAALGAQFATDFLVSELRERVGLGIRTTLRLQVGLAAWVYLVDVLLSPIGLLAALVAVDEPAAVLLVLPLAVLLGRFAAERRAGLQAAVELGRAYRGTTLLLSEVLDADDEYTGAHSRDVVGLSVAVGRELGLDERRMRNVEFGALLHDIGKIAVPNEIINKPGPLTDDEWVVIKAHTVEGQRMLDRVGGVLGDVGRVVRSSHERWDGGGYPDRLAGEAIPLESSIVSACDAFNAMTTDRAYRRGRPPAAALEEVRACSGTQFSPVVVDALARVVERTLVPAQAKRTGSATTP